MSHPTVELEFVGVPRQPSQDGKVSPQRLHPARSRVAGMLAGLTGFRLPSGSEAALDDAIRTRAAARGTGGVTEYLQSVCAEPDVSELEQLFDLVSVGQTAFFRSGSTLGDFVRHVCAHAAERAGPVRIWCAGCASGEEVWSAAAVACVTLGDAAGRLEIVGSDLSRPALDRAHAGRYAGTRRTEIPVGLRVLFEVDGDTIEPGPRLRSVVRFARHNLVAETVAPLEPPVDAVLFRNVGIYFTEEVVTGLVGRFHALLRPGGHLLLGRAESLWGMEHPFETVEIGSTFAYRKPERSHAGPAPVDGGRRGIARGKASLPPCVRRPPVSPARTGAARPGDDISAVTVAEAVAGILGRLVAGHVDDVLGDIESLVESEPLVPEAHYLLATAWDRKGETDRAYESYRKATYLDARFALGHFGVASVLERRGESERAAAAYEAAAQGLVSDAGRFEPFLESMESSALHDLCVDKAMALRAG